MNLKRNLFALALMTGWLAVPQGAWAQNTPGAPTASAAAAVKVLPFVSPIFGDNMVLQRGKENAIWGWAEPGEKIRVEIGKHHATAVAGPDRKWQVKIQPPAPGGPYRVKIVGSTTVELQNIMVGDVWICGGQSNMELALPRARNGAEEVKAANHPDIRFIKISPRTAYRRVPVIEGSWKPVTPQTADAVSAVAYYFARKLNQETHIPIGLVVDAVGGTPAESWSSAEALRPLGDFDVQLAELQRLAAEGVPEYGNFVMHWYDRYDIGEKQKWHTADLDDSDWKSISIPSNFSEVIAPDSPAVVWLRREITLPDPLPAARMSLIHLGSIERMDTVYINGKQVGASSWVENPRVYPLFPGVLKPGRNVVAIRVLRTKPNGGFLGKPEELFISMGQQEKVSLAGAWKAKLSVDARPPMPLPIGYENWPVMPTVLYEGMLAPLAPLSITGAIWYQGEQNASRGFQYRKVLPAMITDWRRLFGQGDFPFYVVSLPAFQQRSATPTDDGWADTRESQALAAAAVPNAALVVTIDTGDANDIHPKDKVPVGERLAACALKGHYGKKVVASGPTLASVERLEGAIRLRFANTDGGLVVKGDKLGEFSIAGEDQKWVWAEARIEGDTVVVSSPQVPHPVEVRYAWQSNPLATLFNGAGFPAGPFRTDHWPCVTQDAK